MQHGRFPRGRAEFPSRLRRVPDEDAGQHIGPVRVVGPDDRAAPPRDDISVASRAKICRKGDAWTERPRRSFRHEHRCLTRRRRGHCRRSGHGHAAVMARLRRRSAVRTDPGAGRLGPPVRAEGDDRSRQAARPEPGSQEGRAAGQHRRGLASRSRFSARQRSPSQISPNGSTW